MLDTVLGQILAICSMAILVFALLKGDEPERIGAGAFAIGWLASVTLQDDGKLFSMQWGLFALDVLFLVVFIGLALRYRRAWTIAACGFQGLIVLSHIMVLIDVRPALAAYYTVINMASYGVLLALGVGTFWAWQERRAAGLE